MKFDTKTLVIGGILFLGIVVGGSLLLSKQTAQKTAQIPFSSPTITSTSQTNLANPASTNCLKEGGTLIIKKRGDGGEYGVCDFGDNRQCEEWALFRGDCLQGGIKVTGFYTDAQIYCAISGGKTVAQVNAPCTLPGNIYCTADTYFNGTCPPAKGN